MNNPNKKTLETPESFEFPFPPYDIQQNFMKSLYETLEAGKFGIFESPTGTVSNQVTFRMSVLKW